MTGNDKLPSNQKPEFSNKNFQTQTLLHRLLRPFRNQHQSRKHVHSGPFSSVRRQRLQPMRIPANHFLVNIMIYRDITFTSRSKQRLPPTLVLGKRTLVTRGPDHGQVLATERALLQVLPLLDDETRLLRFVKFVPRFADSVHIEFFDLAVHVEPVHGVLQHGQDPTF